MNRGLICVTLILGILACTRAEAQPPGPATSTKSQMYEDIEVMGRILDRALHLPLHSTVQVPITQPNFGGFGGGGGFGGSLGGGFQGQQLGIGGGQGGISGGQNNLGSGQIDTIGFAGGQGFTGGLSGLNGGGFNTTRMVRVPVPSYPKAQGTYIKGHGVVYTILMPPPKHEPKAAQPLPQSQNEWDRVRQQIRGENPTSPAPLLKAKEPSVADLVLEALAKYGHHFSQLGDQESLTVSIIYRLKDQAHGDNVHRNYLKRLIGLPGDTLSVGPNNNGFIVGGDFLYLDTLEYQIPIQANDLEVSVPSEVTQTSPPAAAKESSEKKKRGAGGGTTTPDQGSSDYELLGDLHLKQGQGVEALRAYQQALAKSSDVQHAAAMYLKMAQLYLTILKDDAEAKHAMERAKELLAQAPAKVAPLADKSAPKPKTAAPPLPARLIITAPKRLLDQVGTGKLSLEEFKKAASVEHLSFGAAQK